MDKTNTAILILCLELSVVGSNAAETQYPSDTEPRASIDSADAQNVPKQSPTILANRLQSVLDRGEDLLLEQGKTYEVRETLRFTKAGQRIATRNAKRIGKFAKLKLAPGATVTLIDGAGIQGVTIENIILDGNRRQLATADGTVPDLPLVTLGQQGGDQQTVRRCVVLNSRSGGGWAAIHVHENGRETTIEDNIIFGSGVDVRGNGRSPHEHPMGWADGISIASRDCTVRNNLVMDATDEGIMVQGAAGSLVENNVVSAVSREMLAGIALIDASKHYRMEAGARRFDYRGVVVRNNLIDNFGARIHMGIAMGGLSWGKHAEGTALVGATVTDNVVTGRAGGYGFVANGIDEFTVTGNTSTATYSGIADGLPKKKPDPPGAFLYDPDNVGSSELQAEFKPKSDEGHLIHVLRNFWFPKAPSGYRIAEYGKPEAKAVARAALIEVFGNEPNQQAIAKWSAQLLETKASADSLRRDLMGSESFKNHAKVYSQDLEQFRTQLWLEIFIRESQKITEKQGVKWPSAKALYAAAIRSLTEVPRK